MTAEAQTRTRSAPAGHADRPARIAHWLYAAPAYLVLGAGAVLMLFPFVWMVLGSFKTVQESNLFPPTLLPRVWHVQNYWQAWVTPPSTLGRYFLNSLVIAGVGTGLQLLIGVLAAYAFARLRFRGRDLLFLLVLATSMIPAEITTIPNFVTIRRFPLLGGNDLFGAGGSGLYDTYTAMILPSLAQPFTIFLLRQAFLQVPNEFWEAAQLDGSGGLGYLWRILLPLTTPALFTVAVFGFLGRWNALLWPLIVTRSESLRPIQVAMIYYQNEFLTDFGMVMAASFMATLPMIALFLVAQRQFIAGIASTGLKG
jgi:multiple sugar transport system permease protein